MAGRKPSDDWVESVCPTASHSCQRKAVSRGYGSFASVSGSKNRTLKTGVDRITTGLQPIDLALSKIMPGGLSPCACRHSSSHASSWCTASKDLPTCNSNFGTAPVASVEICCYKIEVTMNSSHRCQRRREYRSITHVLKLVKSRCSSG